LHTRLELVSTLNVMQFFIFLSLATAFEVKTSRYVHDERGTRGERESERRRCTCNPTFTALFNDLSEKVHRDSKREREREEFFEDVT